MASQIQKEGERLIDRISIDPQRKKNASSKLANGAAEYGMLPMHEEKAILIRMDATKPFHKCREILYEERKPCNSPLSIGPKNSSSSQRSKCLSRKGS